jgi:hypothetical protein
MIRRTLLVVWLLLGAAGLAALPARGEPPDEADRTAIRGVIERQIEAFRRDDGEAAFGFAAPSIRQMFGTVETFMAMVRDGYRPVYRPQAWRFGAVQMIDDMIVQKVHIVGPDGAPVTAFYIMERQPDGTWRIAGCSLGAPEEESA